MASKKKKDVKKTGGGGGWPSSGTGSASGTLPDAAKSRLWDLFGAIEHEFESLHAENAARECARTRVKLAACVPTTSYLSSEQALLIKKLDG